MADQVEKKSLVQCRIEACSDIDRIVEQTEVSIVEAMKILAGRSGVPYGTLNRWYYMDEESKNDPKTEVAQPPKTTTKTKSKVAAKIVENINKALDKEEEDAMSTSHGKAAKELANSLGGAVLAEELYELFLKSVSKLDEIIKANKELAEPMSTDKVTDQLLRLARNVGWTEPVVEEPKVQDTTSKCTKCIIKSCPNKMCDNHVEKKKKKVKVKAKLPLRLPKKAKKVWGAKNEK
jgi:hypothetical protein